MSRFASFREFYPFYLSEHRHPVSRRLHFIGSCGVLLLVATALLRGQPLFLLGALFCGYGFAWVGHFSSRRTDRRRSAIRCTRSWVTG